MTNEHTGIIRRFDDLGRIVIPKEIRKKCGLENNCTMEIFVNTDGDVVLKKYKNRDMAKLANELLQELEEDFNRLGVRFIMTGSDIECYSENSSVPRVGIASCYYQGKYQPQIGMVLAFYNALNMPMPEEFKV